MNPSVFVKQPWPRRQLAIDFTDSIHVGDSLLSIDSITALLDGVDVSSTIIYGVPYIVGNKVYIVLQGGTNGLTYDIRFRLNTTDGDQIEDDLDLVIKEKS